MKSLGKFDIVYSWGVLHHTGDMWRALEYAQLPVACGGKLFIAIYNNMGSPNVRWRFIKKVYNKLPAFVRPAYTLCITAPGEAKSMLRALLTLSFGNYIRAWTQYGQHNRGMSHWRDTVDWVGGYPLRICETGEIFDFYRARGFSLAMLKCGCVGLGCNEFVFLRENVVICRSGCRHDRSSKGWFLREPPLVGMREAQSTGLHRRRRPRPGSTGRIVLLAGDLNGQRVSTGCQVLIE